MGSFSLILIATITFLTSFTNACNGVISGGGGNSGGDFVCSHVDSSCFLPHCCYQGAFQEVNNLINRADLTNCKI